MPREWRAAVATVPVLFTVALSVDYLADGTAMGIHDVRTMAVTALLLGLTAAVLGAWSRTGAAKWLGVPALAAAILALVTGNGIALAVLVGLIIVLWAVSTVRHLRTPAGRP